MRSLTLAVLLLLPGAAVAQPLACEDRARIDRELIGRLTAERTRSEVETATELARLRKLLEQVVNERDAARAQLPAGQGAR